MQLRLTSCTLDLETGLVASVQGPRRLSALECALLSVLHAASPQAVPRGVLLERVWGLSPTTRTRCVDTAITRLRKKVEATPAEPQHLLKVHGVGYRLLLRPPAALLTPLAAVARDLPAAPDLLGRAAALQAICEAILHHPVVTIVGPPGAGTTALAIAACHAAGGDFSAVSAGARDPGPGALWLRDRAPGAPAAATQLYTGGLRGLPGELPVVVPALPAQHRAALLPAPAALRASVGGLAGALCRLHTQLSQGGAHRLVPSDRPVGQHREALRRLSAAQAPLCAEDVTRLCGVSARELLLAGWLLQDGERYTLPWTLRASLGPPRDEDFFRFAAWFEESLDALGAQEPAAGRARWRTLRVHLSAVIAALLEQDPRRCLALVTLRGGPWLCEELDAERLSQQLSTLLEVAATSPEEKIRASGPLITALWRAGRLDRAEAVCAEALRVCEAAGLGGAFLGRLLGHRADLALLRGRRREALATYQDSAALLDAEAPDMASFARTEAAKLLFGEGRLAEATALARETVRAAQALPDPLVRLRCESQLGTLLCRLGHSWEGIPRLQRVRAEMEEAGAQRQLAPLLLELGMAELDRGDPTAAAEHLTAAHALAVSLDAGLLAARIASAVGMAAQLSGQQALATEWLQRSVIGYEDGDLSERSWWPLLWLALALPAPTAALAAQRAAALAAGRPDQLRCVTVVQRALSGQREPMPDTLRTTSADCRLLEAAAHQRAARPA